MNPSAVGHRAPVLWLLLPVMAGLALGRAGWFPLAPLPGLCVAGIALAVAALWRTAWAPAFVATALVLGGVLHDLTRARLPAWETLPVREAVVTVVIDRLFAPGEDPQRVSGLGRIRVTEPHLRDLTGQRIAFSLRTDPGQRVLPSTELAVVALLEVLPAAPAHGTFEHYLDTCGVNFRLHRGRITHIVRPPSAYQQFCATASDRFETILRLGLEDKPSLGQVYRAMLLGRKAELSDEQDDLFLRSGTLHLFAISGLHIATLATAFHIVLALLPWPRGLRFALATLALWLYTDVTGGTPSAVRAFIMATLLASLPVLRLPGNSLAALAVSALVVLLLEPLQLFSASFQMSYGIVAALLAFGLPLAEAWSRPPAAESHTPTAAHTPGQRWLGVVRRRMILSLSLAAAATVVSTVSGIAFFNLVTPAGLVANLVLIPLASLVVLAGCAALISGLLGIDALALLFNHAAALVLHLIEVTVRALVALPGASLAAEFRRPWLGPAGLAVVLALMLYGYARRWRPEAGGFWPPAAALVLLLALGVRYG